ncbi:transient receptor potential-gamma protein-like [Bolinopsis microptera]|uniref:transient receptor potential-gamma protein-like n=1 Tax=Bolinopsis microptera TaxID=2820187 RepID=UPI00307A03CA
MGCPAFHYSTLNLANKEDGKGNSTLIMAAKVDCKMVEIILSYGGNPNHANQNGDMPLSIAANRYDKETINSLLHEGGDLETAVVRLTSSLRHDSQEKLRENNVIGFCSRPLIFLLADDAYLRCRDPIKTAFRVSNDIKRIKHVRNEFETEFELLIENADTFAYTFLDQCDKMTDAKEIILYPENLLKTAIKQEKKQFVSHPFNQQIINESWNGDFNNTLLYGKTLIALKYIASPIMLPLLFLKLLLVELPRGIKFMESSFAELLKLKFTPCMCFITDALNYLIFLMILICACIFPTDGKYQVGGTDYLLYFCVLSRLIIEIDFLVQQGWGYLRHFWNIVDIIVIVMLCVGAVHNVMIQYRVDGLLKEHKEKKEKIDYKATEGDLMRSHQDSMNVYYMYAVAEFILTLRILGLLEVFKSLGTMMIALKYLVIDVLNFGILLLTVIFGTSIAIYSMTISIHRWNKELKSSVAIFFDGAEDHIFTLLPYNHSHPEGEVTAPAVFETFYDTMRNIMWSTFGLLDVVNLAVEHEARTTVFINIILILYILLSCVLLLNMLIGILGSTFDRIKDNCDIEWKYARSKLLKDYIRAQPLLFPYFAIFFPFIIWFRRRLREERSRKKEKDTSLTTNEETERDKLISALCDRFTCGNLVEESGGKFSDMDQNGGTFEQRIKIRRQRSVLHSSVKVKEQNAGATT